MATTFTTNLISLKTFLDGLREGVIQLPDFKRGWVWDDECVRSVFASVFRAFPIGAVMMLQTGGEARFKTRPVQGINENDAEPPSQLILDGQQRSSRFQAMLLPPEATSQGLVLGALIIRYRTPVRSTRDKKLP